MRKSAAIVSVFLLLVAACGEGVAPEHTVCDDASEHMSSCLGDQAPPSTPGACDEATAEALLAADCEAIRAEVGAAPDDKNDVAGWAEAVACYYRLKPLTECFPENWRGEMISFTVDEIIDGEPHAKKDVTVRFRHKDHPEIAVEATSDGYGEFLIKVPDTAFGAPDYFIDVVYEDEIWLTTDNDGYFPTFMSVRFSGDGGVSICRFLDDDYCEEMAPL